jgi:predicted Rossmann fold nucleotide-binding protein DprA/Smf involved in DNA uptake
MKLLLCNRLGTFCDTISPLSLSEFRRLNEWADEHGLSLWDLASDSRAHSQMLTAFDRNFGIRVVRLLDRVPDLIRCLEHWLEMGIWIIGDSDPDYPQRLVQRLQHSAPQLIFGVGNRALLQQGGICLVGSRDSSTDGLLFADAFTARCCSEGLTLISSDMRGVDRKVVSGVIDGGGNLVCVLSDSLEKMLSSRRFRHFETDEKTVLVTPYSPEMRFRVGNAIRINRYQYCLSDLAIIVETRSRGGLWTGAEENKNHNWVRGFVRAGPRVPGGNKALLHLGYYKPLTQQEIVAAHSLQELLIARMNEPVSSRKGSSNGHKRQATDALFTEFTKCMSVNFTGSPTTSKQLAKAFKLELVQVEAWIKHGVALGLIEQLPKGIVKLVD